MRAKLIKERLEFTKKDDPKKSLDVGKDSLYVKENLYKKLKEKYRFVDWYKDEEDNKKAINDYIKNIYEIEKFINKLEKFDIKIKNISGLYGINFEIEVFRVINSNYIILQCVSEEDANLLIDIIKKFHIPNYYNFKIDEGDYKLNLKEDVEEWFNNLENNRQKIKSII